MIPPAKHGQRLNLDLVNRIIQQANVSGRIDPGDGGLVKSSLAGIQLSREAIYLLSQEPAESVVVVNKGADAIHAYGMAGIVKSLPTETGDLMNQRVFSVRKALPEDAGQFVIAHDIIEPGGAGLAWCSGVCLVRLFRWFDSELLDRADVTAGERYARASIDGGLDILWSQRSDDDQLIVDQEHFAVVRFNGRKGMRWYNSGTVDVPFGCPIVTLNTATDGLINGVLTGRAPTATDTLASCFINLGGTVAPGKFGRCTADIALARAKASYDANSTVGAEASQTSVSSSGSGLIVMARMGAYQGQQYDIVKPAAGSGALYTIVITGGNTLSDGSTLGIKWASPAPATVPSLYDPNVTSTFIDGIGRGQLYIDRTLQSGYVLVANYAGNGSPLTLGLVQGQTLATSASRASLLLAGDPTQGVSLFVPQAP